MKNIANYFEEFIDDDNEHKHQSNKKLRKMKDYMSEDKHNPKLKSKNKKYK
jgi:hypothetical protein